MKSSLLSSARNHQKKHEWTEAIGYYEQYIKEYKDESDDKIYVAYAKCLRASGNTDYAKKILTSARELYPESERTLKEFYTLYDHLGEWKPAKSIAQALIDVNDLEANHYFRLGRAYAFLSNYSEAKEVYANGLKYRHGISFNELTEKIEKGFTDNLNDISSEYIFTSGRNNLGAFIHKHGNKKYFTKVSKYTQSAQREEYFYKNVSTKFPTLKQIIPEYVNSQVIDKVLYLTSEMIEGIDVASNQAKEVISISQNITSIKYEEIIRLQTNPKYMFKLKNRPISVVQFFTKIHEKNYNEKLFSVLYKLLEQNNYPESVVQMIKHLEQLIMSNHLYSFIKPKDHYALLHGDFISQNIKVKNQDETLHVFDWATSTIGPHFIDIARLLTSLKIPYSEIESIYLSNHETGGKLSIIEKIFFLYALILLYLLTFKEKNAEKHMDEYMLPALNNLERLVTEFKNVEFGEAIESILDEKKEYRKKIEESEQRVQMLTKEKEAIQKKYKNTLDSKSWKITAPLRRIVLWKNKPKQK